MSPFWEAVAERSDGQYTADALEMTAFRLVAEQVLYYSDKHSRTAYWMVSTFEKEYRKVLADIGVDVGVNREKRYAYGLPRHAKAGTASTMQTLFALVLRQIYDEAARVGQFIDNSDGEVACDLDELSEKFRLMTGRELPMKGRLDALMDSAKRWGLARKSEDRSFDDANDAAAIQPYMVIIRPAIADLLGEAALARMLEFQTATAVTPGGRDTTENDFGDSATPHEGDEGESPV